MPGSIVDGCAVTLHKHLGEEEGGAESNSALHALADAAKEERKRPSGERVEPSLEDLRKNVAKNSTSGKLVASNGSHCVTIVEILIGTMTLDNTACWTTSAKLDSNSIIGCAMDSIRMHKTRAKIESTAHLQKCLLSIPPLIHRVLSRLHHLYNFRALIDQKMGYQSIDASPFRPLCSYSEEFQQRK